MTNKTNNNERESNMKRINEYVSIDARDNVRVYDLTKCFRVTTLCREIDENAKCARNKLRRARSRDLMRDIDRVDMSHRDHVYENKHRDAIVAIIKSR